MDGCTNQARHTLLWSSRGYSITVALRNWWVTSSDCTFMVSMTMLGSPIMTFQYSMTVETNNISHSSSSWRGSSLTILINPNPKGSLTLCVFGWADVAAPSHTEAVCISLSPFPLLPIGDQPSPIGWGTSGVALDFDLGARSSTGNTWRSFIIKSVWPYISPASPLCTGPSLGELWHRLGSCPPLFPIIYTREEPLHNGQVERAVETLETRGIRSVGIPLPSKL